MKFSTKTGSALFFPKDSEGIQLGRFTNYKTHTTQTHTRLTLTCDANGQYAVAVFGNERYSHLNSSGGWAGETVTWSALQAGTDMAVLEARYDYFRLCGCEITYHYLGTNDNIQGDISTAHIAPRGVAVGAGTTDLTQMDEMMYHRYWSHVAAEGWRTILLPTDRTFLNFTETIDNSAAYPRTDREMSVDRWLGAIIYFRGCGNGSQFALDIYRNWEGVLKLEKVLDGLRSFVAPYVEDAQMGILHDMDNNAEDGITTLSSMSKTNQPRSTRHSVKKKHRYDNI